ncbi:hypothetical protein ABT008_29960 [Micromonospora sp. NPDC002389]|uniref:hypothetical protein n=1 Tax=Micromonospora sp. NPDC002389 TaxID=3154272 RepID=UPI003329DBE8
MAVAKEIARADEVLRSLAGEEINTITINSLDAEDAPFLALVISKLSPMIGNLLERKIIHILDREVDHGMHWVRQDPGFPDALLVDNLGDSAEAGYEVKAWYALSTELTGRFRESLNLLAPRNVRVVIVAWCMSHVVYGVPQIIDVLTVSGAEVASSRDVHYWNPPSYLTVEPGDTTLRTRNLQQTNVNGYRLQDVTDAQEIEALALVAEKDGRRLLPSSPEAQLLAQQLMANYPYRLDTNFAKIDRVDNPHIERFKAEVLNRRMRDRTMKQWVQLLKGLSSEKASVREQCEMVMKAIYSEL